MSAFKGQMIHFPYLFYLPVDHFTKHSFHLYILHTFLQIYECIVRYSFESKCFCLLNCRIDGTLSVHVQHYSSRTYIRSVYFSVDALLQGLCILSGFFYNGLQLTRKLLSKGFFRKSLLSLLRFFGRHHDLVDHYEIFISQTTMNISQWSTKS